MEHVIQDLKEQPRDRCTPRPDRAEIADVLHQAGWTDGFSMEWIFDRYAPQDHLYGGQI